MGECPFCGGAVDEDLITFGGTCPKCFGDIPGEEAATDPGEDVKAAQARSDRMRMLMRTLLPVALVLPVLLCLGMTALWFTVLKPEPELVMLDFDQLEEYPMPELVAASEEPAEEPEPEKPAVEPGPAEPAGDADDGVAEAEVPEPEPVAQPEPEKPKSAGLNLDLDVTTERRLEILDESEAITKMIAARMRAQAPRLNACYESALKKSETLRGRWTMSFFVSVDGMVKGASTEGLTASDPEFEACLVRELGKWTFQRIAYERQVKKTFTFRPAF